MSWTTLKFPSVVCTKRRDIPTCHHYSWGWIFLCLEDDLFGSSWLHWMAVALYQVVAIVTYFIYSVGSRGLKHVFGAKKEEKLYYCMRDERSMVSVDHAWSETSALRSYPIQDWKGRDMREGRPLMTTSCTSVVSCIPCCAWSSIGYLPFPASQPSTEAIWGERTCPVTLLENGYYGGRTDDEQRTQVSPWADPLIVSSTGVWKGCNHGQWLCLHVFKILWLCCLCVDHVDN